MWCGTNVVSAELPDTACLKYFSDIGKKCVLDLNAGETYTPVQSPESDVETVARMPFFPHCQVAVMPYDTVVPVRGTWTFPGRNTGCAEIRCSPGREVRGRLGLYKAGLGG